MEDGRYIVYRQPTLKTKVINIMASDKSSCDKEQEF